MRPLTKVVLVVCLIGLMVVVLFIASRQFGATGKTPAVAATTERTAPPRAEADRTEDKSAYSDPAATLHRWRSYLPGEGSGHDEPPAARPDKAAPRTGKAAPVARRPRVPDTESTSRDEGTVVASGREEAVYGADPPGPALRPDDIPGEVVRGVLRGRPSADPANTHVIVAGDTLSQIASQRYGSSRYVNVILEANPGLDPKSLKPGAKIFLPDISKAEDPTSAPGAAVPAPASIYVVNRGDTLIRIAIEQYGEASMYPRIYEANKDILSSPNARLYVGQRLRLPPPN